MLRIKGKGAEFFYARVRGSRVIRDSRPPLHGFIEKGKIGSICAFWEDGNYLLMRENAIMNMFGTKRNEM